MMDGVPPGPGTGYRAGRWGRTPPPRPPRARARRWQDETILIGKKMHYQLLYTFCDCDIKYTWMYFLRQLSATDDDSTYTWNHDQNQMVRFCCLIVILILFRKLFEACGNSGLIGYLIGGIIVGPHVFDIVDYYAIESIRILGRIGVCLLILEAGLHTGKFLI